MSKAPVTMRCGAKKKQGKGKCELHKGWGTDHVGQGRCKLHGGASPIKSGRYSTVKRKTVRELAKVFESDPDPLNLLPELAQARALYQEYIDRCELPLTDKNRATWNPQNAAALLGEISRAAKRIEDVRAQNAISRRDFYRVMTEMGRIVDLVVKDGDQLDRIHHQWGSIKLA